MRKLAQGGAQDPQHKCKTIKVKIEKSLAAVHKQKRIIIFNHDLRIFIESRCGLHTNNNNNLV